MILCGMTWHELNNFIRCDFDKGLIFWKIRSSQSFKTDGVIGPERAAKIWNSRYAEKLAFNNDDGSGYRRGCIFKKQERAHRILWFMRYGKVPDFIDHIDGNRSNNSIDNLREVTKLENCRNASLRKDSPIGQTGISKTSNGRWIAAITVDRKNIRLGTFDELANAIVARKQAEADFGFHKNHGKEKCK